MPESNQWEINAQSTATSPSFGVREMIGFFFRNFFILFGGLAIGVLVGLTAQHLIPRTFESEAKFVVDDLPYGQGLQNMDAETQRQLVQTLIESIPSADMRTGVARRIGD